MPGRRTTTGFFWATRRGSGGGTWRQKASKHGAGQISLETAPPPMLEALRAWHPGGRPQISWILEQQRRMASDSTELAPTDEQLQRVTPQTLVVHGDRDELLPIINALELAARLPRALLLILPGGSHGFMMEGGLASQLLAVALSESLGGQTPDRSPHPTPP